MDLPPPPADRSPREGDRLPAPFVPPESDRPAPSPPTPAAENRVAPQPSAAPNPSSPLFPSAPARTPSEARPLLRRLIDELRAQKSELLAEALANSHLLGLTHGVFRLGFGADGALFRRQIERALPEIRTACERLFGEGGVATESLSTPPREPTLAAEDETRHRAHEAQLKREGREAPAVLAALRIFSGVIEDIRPLDNNETSPPLEDEILYIEDEE